MLMEMPVHKDGVWNLQNETTKEMTAQVRSVGPWGRAASAPFWIARVGVSVVWRRVWLDLVG